MRKFHLGDILSITTGRLVSPRHMDGVDDILNYMTQDNLFTHQLPRAAEECAPWLIRRHPQLAKVQVPDTFEGKDHVDRWLVEQVRLYGEELEVGPIPRDDHEKKDPLTELEEMVGKDKIIVVKLPDHESGKR
jgi:hypothetical protein